MIAIEVHPLPQESQAVSSLVLIAVKVVEWRKLILIFYTALKKNRKK